MLNNKRTYENAFDIYINFGINMRRKFIFYL